MKRKSKWEFRPNFGQYRRYLQRMGYEISPQLTHDEGAHPKKELIFCDIEDERTIIGLLEGDRGARNPPTKSCITLFEIEEPHSLLQFSVSLLKAHGIPVPEELLQSIRKDVKTD